MALDGSLFVENATVNEVIRSAVRAGTLVLENGGETYRAEDTIVYTARSLGAKNPSAFVTPTVVMFSCVDEENRHHSSLVRITTRSVNLRKIARVNALSRRLVTRGRLSNAAQVSNLLDRIGKSKGFPKPLLTLFAALSSFCFAFLFGGGWREALAALIIGAALRFFLLSMEKLPVNDFIRSLLSGALISFLADFALMMGFIPSSAITVTAVLMQVVPGLAMVNGIRDIIAGDLISGTARLVEACMVGVALSVGAVFGILIFPEEIFHG